ncbi:MAG: hypothetical protein ACR2LJ_14345 [Acidimicrobiales bacterium]
MGYLLKDRATATSFVADLRSIAAGGLVVDPEVVSVLLRRRDRDGDGPLLGASARSWP